MVSEKKSQFWFWRIWSQKKSLGFGFRKLDFGKEKRKITRKTLDQVNSANILFDFFFTPIYYMEESKDCYVDIDVDVGGEEKRRRKRRKIFGEGEYLFFWRRIKTEKEKEENIWRRQIFFYGGEENRRRKRR